jgi:peptidoglycan/LPS O-acetylase OafA/YrhL
MALERCAVRGPLAFTAQRMVRGGDRTGGCSLPMSDDTRTREPATAAVASRLGYRPELDGVRGVAILLVMLVHVHHWPRGGFIGVDVFFTLSGFLITTLLLEEWQARGKISLRNFYARRALRLFPAVVVLLVAYLIFALVAGGSYLTTRLAGVGYGFTYLSNWAQAYGLAFPEQEIGFLWTLAIEEQFYLLWPGLLLLAVHFGRLSARRVIVATLCVVAAGWVWRILLVEAGVEGPRTYFGTDTRLDQLLLGAALAAWFVRRPSSAAGSPALRLAGWAGVMFLTWRLFDSVYFRWWYPTIGLAAIGLASTAIIACVVTDSSPVLKWTLNMRWLRWVGALSYSLYLWHVPAIRLVEGSPLGQFTVLRILGGISLSFVLAAASYRYVEQPFLRRRKKHERLSATKADAEADAGALQLARHPAVLWGRASLGKAAEP